MADFVGLASQHCLSEALYTVGIAGLTRPETGVDDERDGRKADAAREIHREF